MLSTIKTVARHYYQSQDNILLWPRVWMGI